MVKSYRYDAFGNEIGAATDDINPFRYGGQYFDKETGDYYLRARYYDPANDRFTQQDDWQYAKVNDPLSLNLYTYGQDDPVDNVDPSGHWVMDAIFLAMDIAQFAMHPSWCNAAWLLLDVASFADPTGAASTAAHIAKGVGAAVKGAKVIEEGVKVVEAGVKVTKAAEKITEVGHAAGEEGVNIALKYKKGWSSAQKAEANVKVATLSEAKTVKTSVQRSGTSAATKYKKANGVNSIAKGKDVDHTVDLQLGGKDHISNMKPLDMSVNRSLGKQIQNAIKKYPAGIKFNKFSIH